MRNILLSLGVVLLFIGCTKFEIITEIDPKISIIERNVGFMYKLGDIQISHTIEKVDRDIINYIKEEKDDAVFMLRVYYDEEASSGLRFFYFINGISINEKTQDSPITKDMLISHMDKIPGFYLYKLDGEEVSKENKEAVEEKIKKVKERVKEESGDKYSPAENKWE